jgi:hypothetical protein
MEKTDFIDVPIGRSRVLAAVLVSLHAAAMAAVVVLPIAWWIRLTGCALLLASASLTVRQYAFVTGSQACSRLRIANDGVCRLELDGSRIVTGRLLSGWLASPFLTVVQVHCKNERLARKLVLLPDSSDSETLRRLRIFLRFSIDRSAGKK